MKQRSKRHDPTPFITFPAANLRGWLAAAATAAGREGNLTALKLIAGMEYGISY